jgi:aryl-alcohol dehydrogenase-like predicted oxidoreductase
MSDSQIRRSQDSSLCRNQTIGTPKNGAAATLGRTPRDGQSKDLMESTDYWRLPDGNLVSAICLGTRTGLPNESTDSRLEEVILFALQQGLNFFDTGPDYRFGRSEEVLGRSLSRAFDERLACPDQVCVMTKVGSIPPSLHCEGSRSLKLESGQAVVPTSYRPRRFGGRCFEASWIAESIRRSRFNLSIETLGVVLLDGLEWGLAAWGTGWPDKVSALFETLESERSSGSIKWYGISSGVGVFCVPGHYLHLPIGSLVNLAQGVGGSSNGFRFIEVPFNAENLAVATRMAQPLNEILGSVLLAAMDHQLDVLACSPFNHGRLFDGIRTETFIEEKGVIFSAAQWMLQFVRSMPGISCAVLGTTRKEHLEQALAVGSAPPWDLTTLERIMSHGAGTKSSERTQA